MSPKSVRQGAIQEKLRDREKHARHRMVHRDPAHTGIGEDLTYFENGKNIASFVGLT